MSDWYDGELPEEEAKDERTIFELTPLRNALRFAVEIAKRHRTAQQDDDIVLIGRVAQAALTWQALDEAGKLEEAERWLKAIPR